MIAVRFLSWSSDCAVNSLATEATSPPHSPSCFLSKDSTEVTRLRKNMSNRLIHLCDKLQVAQTSHHPDHHRPTQEHFPD
jgi:hypothetical protein